MKKVSARRPLRLAVASLLALAAAGGMARFAARPPAISVSPAQSLQAALTAAPAGAEVRLEPGTHVGPVTIEKRVTIRGPASAVVVAPVEARAAITVRADGVELRGFGVEGGESGIQVVSSAGAVLEGLSIRGALMEGIDVADAHATIRAVEVSGLTDPRAQGIEIRNSEHRGIVTVGDSFVDGGQEGLVAHVSRVRFENNVVQNTTMHGVSITEMSRGIAADNVVSGATGAGLYCGDMSLCDFRGNRVSIVRAADATRSGSGWGLLVHYHSSAHSAGDSLTGSAGAVGVFEQSHLRDRSPLRLGDGWKGLAPALAVIPGAILGLMLAYVIAGLGTRRIRGRTGAGLRWVTPLVLVGLGIQTFHMLEHGLQVYRVYFDGVPSRGGIVGPVVEAEVIHFTYNILVFGSFAAILWARSRGWSGPPRPRADALLGGAVLLQGYHVVEHTLKLLQHLSTGRRVNPGLAGHAVDLVWFHFGINLAVYLGFAAAALILLSPRLRVPRAGRLRATVTSPAD